MSARHDTWMPMYWGDYTRDTGNLNNACHGAYLMLIKHYWCTAKPLSDDDDELWRIACCDSKKEWIKIKQKLLRLFVVDNGILRHKRVDREIAKTKAISTTKAGAGRKGAETRWQKHGTPMADAIKVPSDSDAPLPLPLPLPSEKKETSLRDAKKVGSGQDAEHAAFWTIYPRKQEGQAACHQAWVKARKTATFEAIMDGLRRYPFKPDFLPMAATWLNQKRWTTEPDTALPNGNLPGGQTTLNDWNRF